MMPPTGRHAMVPRKDRKMALDTEKANGAPANDGWASVNVEEDGIQIKFDTIGDEFIGEYRGKRTQEMSDGKTMRQDKFAADGVLYFTNSGFDLKKKLDKVRVGQQVRIQYTEDLDTGQASPMRIFAVATKR
jgi:hypothetical protein